MKFYIADWHYGHKNILSYDGRPFESVEHMNEELVARWNKAVGKGDLVYILGDMFWCTPAKAVPVLEGLNGRKILVRGNHDYLKHSGFRNQFLEVCDYLEIEDRVPENHGNLKKNLVLCHYPMPSFKNGPKGWVHLYGHVHSTREWTMMEDVREQMELTYGCWYNMVNVGAMMPWMDYTPRTLEEILAGDLEWRKTV